MSWKSLILLKPYKNMKTFWLILLFITSSFSYAQSETAKNRLKTLCSPEFHGRGYVNDGVNIAADYLAAEFEKIGAEKVNDTYFQKLKVNVNTFPDTVSVKIKKKELQLGVEYLVDSYSGSFSGEVSFVQVDPYKIIGKDPKESEKLIKNIKKGKGVLLDKTPFTGTDTLALYDQIAREFSTLVPVVIKTKEKFTWSVGRTKSKFPVIRIQDSICSKIKKLDIHINAKHVKKFKTKNVVAKISGKRSDSCFVYTAHYDHLGRLGSDAYFPGANDNASGTALLLEMAEYYKQNKPDFDIYFLLFTAEEAGLVGSEYFVKNPMFDIKKIKFLLNLDIMGSGEDGITLVNGTVHTEDYDRMVAINDELKLLKVVKSRGKTQNSDHYWFQEQGVKTFFIYTMGKANFYHDIFDTSDSIDMNKFDELKTLFIEFIERYP